MKTKNNKELFTTGKKFYDHPIFLECGSTTGVLIASGFATAFKRPGASLWKSESAVEYEYTVHILASYPEESDCRDSKEGCLLYVLALEHSSLEEGLIYSDQTFQKDIRNILKKAKIPGYNHVTYTEQGYAGS